MSQDTENHITVCQGEVRQCLTCGGRMCDCPWRGTGEFQIFRCIHCGETEVEKRERNGVLALPTQ